MTGEAGKRPARSRDQARYAPREAATVKPVRTRRGLLSWRRANRRITVENRSPFVWLGEAMRAVARRLWVVVKVAAAVAALAGAVYGVRIAVAHIVASPRFALRELRVGAATHLDREQIVALSGVNAGDRLLALDTDVVAARLTRHPWIAAARVRRELPTTLLIDVTERRAAAVAVIGSLYLIDEAGHAFKQATLDEADGLIVLTGVSRPAYAGVREASEAVFREAIGLYAAYKHPDSLALARQTRSHVGRPALSEIHIDPRNGFSLFFLDGGAEIRLGLGDMSEKLARLDEVLNELGPKGIAALRVMHLDGPASDRVPLRLAPPAVAEEAPAASQEVKKSTVPRNASISGKRENSSVARPRLGVD
ncbi:MAG TPA: FtsQ-type POTRA domain-containing protein [Polyangia bacterium]|jgi:cell division septal protein FtsQ